MEELFVGIDIGTSSVKMIACNQWLVSRWSHQVSYKYKELDDGAKEINPDIWYDIVEDGLMRLVTHVNPKQIKGIGVTGQMHTTVFVDNKGKSIRPAIMWNDKRTVNDVGSIKDKLKSSDDTKHLAEVVATGSPLVNLLWLKQYEPDNYNQLHKVLITKDYIVQRLTNQFTTDYCDASTSGMFDLFNRKWSKKVLQLFDLKEDLFPEVKSSSEIVSNLSDELMVKLGLKHSIPVIVGTGDNAASVVAADGLTDDIPIISLGTSGVIIVPDSTNTLKQSGKNIIFSMNKKKEGVITQGTVQSGTQSFNWWTHSILEESEIQHVQSSIRKDSLGSNQVIYFPHLNGEKYLYKNQKMKGAFVGLDLTSTRNDLTQAIMEGLAYGIKDLYQAIKPDEESKKFKAVGGGAKSHLWLEIFSNVLNAEVIYHSAKQDPGYGVAILIMNALGISVKSLNNNQTIVKPTEEIVKRYENKYAKYKSLAKLLNNYY